MPDIRAVTAFLAEVQREIEHSRRRGRNVIKHAMGINPTQVGLSAKKVVWRRDKVELWRYRNPKILYHPPIIFVMSLVTRNYILDLRPGNSVVERFRDAGFDVFLLNWGIPDEADSQNTLETYVDGYLPMAVEAVRHETRSRSVGLLGYCLGGVLSLLFAAAHHEVRLSGLAVMATPVDYSKMGLPMSMLTEGRLDAEALFDHTGNVPAEVIRNSFRIRRPTADAVRLVTLWENLGNDDYLAGYQALNQWINDHIPFPGATASQVTRFFVRENCLATGSIPLGQRKVSLRSVRCPVLNVAAETDDVVPIEAAEPIIRLVGSKDVEELRIKAGHVALVSGRIAAEVTIPGMIDWFCRHSQTLVRARST